MKYVFLAALVLVVLVAPFIVLPRVVVIKKIDCESQFGPRSDIVENAVESVLEKNLRDARKTLKNSLSAHDKVSDFSVTFNLPDNLEVFVVERKASAAVVSKGEQIYTLIDEDGEVVGTSQDTQLPIIVLEDEVSAADISFAAALTNAIYNLYQTRFGRLTNDAIEFEIKDGIKAIFPREGDVEVLVGSLQLILAKV